MTKQELINSEQDFIYANDVACITGESPQAIRLKAKRGKLEYKCIITGNRVRILRTDFINFMNWRT